ncbi:MAG: transcriptional repressor NrdR [Bacteriovoracaceae bacterium]|nr:transcriptional repressor NrdR [Bacteriovoracaceae bacterium]
MHCLNCGTPDTKVIDSRPITDGLTIRRRRKCDACLKRFTTYEKFEIQMPVVVKNDGRREGYNREKILDGITKACQKRQIPMSEIDKFIESIEKYIVENFDVELSSNQIGELVMQRLALLDPVAYVRFASFYWNYNDIDGFIQGLKHNVPLTDQLSL